MFYKNKTDINSYVKVKKIIKFFIDEDKKKKIVSELFYNFISRTKKKKIFSKFYLSKNNIKQLQKMNMLIRGN